MDASTTLTKHQAHSNESKYVRECHTDYACIMLNKNSSKFTLLTLTKFEVLPGAHHSLLF